MRILARMLRGDLCRGAGVAALVALSSVVALAVSAHVARAEVNPDGSFSYTIPIEIPPGSNGVQPNLALVYNSNAGNGMLGVGWQLTGLPTITRMNWGEGINYNGLDTYTGPGGRLVPTGEFGPNGGRIYHTERESWARYEAILGCGAGGAEPCSWVMTDRDGNTRRFGDTADSFIDAVGKGGAARVWALSRFVSTDGNYYSVTYIEDMTGGDYYPGTIQYGPGTHALTIQFNLMTYAGQPIDYSQSARVHIDRILHSISIQDEGLEISRMELSYSQSHRTNHQLISDVVFRSNTTPVVSRTHTFTWNQGAPSLNQKTANTNTLVGDSLDAANLDISRVKFGDYNGDGKTDLMRLNDSGGNGLANTVYFSNGDGSFSETPSNTEVYIGPDLGYAGLDISRIKIGDFNGDGKTDFFRLNDAGGSSVWDTMSIAVGNGHFWQTPSNTMTLVYPTVDWGTLDTSRVISGDFNGDGKTDLIRLNGVNSGGPNTVLFSRGDGGFEGTSDNLGGNLIITASDPSSAKLDISRIFTADFNGDGKTDLLRLNDVGGSGAPDTVFFSSGLGWFIPVSSHMGLYVNPYLEAAQLDISRIRIGDFNGDGKADFMRLNGANTGGPNYLYLARGDGTFEGILDNALLFATSDDLSYAKLDISRVTTGDFNGDGMTDLIRFGGANSSGPNDIWLSRGDGTFQYMVSNAEILVPTTLGYADLTLARIQVGDFNGDGVDDLFFNGGWGVKGPDSVYISEFTGAAFKNIGNVIVAVSTTTGGRTDVSFELATAHQGAIVPMPGTPQHGVPIISPRHLVTQVTESDGRPGGLTTTKTYAYYNGRRYPGTVQQRRDLGFEWVQETVVETGLATKTFYRHDGKYAGEPMRIETSAPGGLVRVETIEYGPVLQPYPAAPDIHQIVQTGHVAQDLVLNTTTTHAAVHDGYGGPTLTTECTNDALGVRCMDTTLQYAHQANPAGPWRIGRQERVTVTSGGNTLADTRYTYHPNGFQLARQEQLLCDQASACGPGSGTWVPVAQNLQYDAGNLVSATDALGRTTTHTYDAAYLAFRASTTRSAGGAPLVEQFTHDAYGRVLTQSDPNGQVTAFQYDGLGRKVREDYPGGGWRTWTYVNDGDPTAQYVELQQALTATETAWERRYYDGLGFIYRIERKGDGGQTVAVLRRQSYASWRKVVEESRPHYAGEPVVWTRSELDPLGRKVREVLPGGLVRDYSYGPGSMTVTENGANPTTEYYDAKRRLIRKVDALGSETVYGYDPMGRLVGVTVANGQPIAQTTTITYDSFGRKTSLDDPSTGLTTYTHDAVGNLLTSADALNRTTLHGYDGLNRRTSTTTHSDEVTTYVYDDPAVPHSKGRLTQVLYPAGSTQYFYDTRGQVTSTRTAINGLGFGVLTAKGYDLAGRVTQIVQDQGGSHQKTVAVAYTAGGNPQSIAFDGTVLAQFEGYNGAGQVGARRVQPGQPAQVTTTYGYDSGGSGLLSTLATQGPGGTLQSLAYQFAPTGNLLSIADNDGQGVDETQAFQYDGLSRLTQAASAGTYGTRAYAYDALGNKDVAGLGGDLQLTYDGMKAVAGQDFLASYDAAGNMLTRIVGANTWAYDYDDHNRLSRAYKNGTLVQESSYDHAGIRTKKVFHDGGQTVTTFYVAGGYELWHFSATNTSKYVYHVSGVDGGKLATDTQEAFGAPTALHDGSGRYFALASLYSPGTWQGLLKKARFTALALLHHARAGQVAYLALLVLLCVVLAAGLVAGARRRARSVRSRYSPGLRLASALVLLAFVAVSCAPEPGQQGSSGGGNPGSESPGGGGTAGPTALDPSVGPPVGMRFHHANHIGSASVITDESGAEINRIVYEPYGKIWAQTSANGELSVAHDYTGQENDPELGLMYYRARFYDPAIGRFLTADTVVPGGGRDAQAFNRYAYVQNNPILYTDPSGHLRLKRIFRKVVRVVAKAVETTAETVEAVAEAHERAVNSARERLRENPWLQQLTVIAACSMGGPLGCAAASAFMTYNNGGSLKDALKAGVIAGVTAYGGAHLNAAVADGSINVFQYAYGQGVMQGFAAGVRGGDIKDGFKVGFLSGLASGAYIQRWGVAPSPGHRGEATFGNNEVGCSSLCAGSSGMTRASHFPFMDTTSKVHDSVVDFFGKNAFTNYGTMAPSFAVGVYLSFGPGTPGYGAY